MTKNSIRYPAEWEKQSATWLAFPHNKTNWYGERGINIRKFYVELIRNITEFQPVNLLLPAKNFLTDEEKAAAKKAVKAEAPKAEKPAAEKKPRATRAKKADQ